MEYNTFGQRIFAKVPDLVGRHMVVRESLRKTEVVLSDKDNFIRLDRDGAVALISGLTAFVANTDGKGDLPEPDAPGGPQR